MFYGDRESQDKKIKNLIEENRTAAQLFPEVRKVIADFDGKVYNKRFQDALQERTGKRIFAQSQTYSQDHGYIYIYIYGSGGYQYTLASLKRSDMKDCKRINAQKMIESARENREIHLKKAYSLEQSMKKIDIIQEQIKDITRLLSAVVGDLDYDITDTYNLPRRLTR